MASSTQYQKEYEKASLAYMQGDYSQAGKLTQELVKACPSDPMYRLLHAHINLALERYQDSIGEYETVLHLTDDNSILEYAHSGIAAAKERLDIKDDSYSMGSADEFSSKQQYAYEDNSYNQSNFNTQGSWSTDDSGGQSTGSSRIDNFDFEDFSSDTSMNGSSQYSYGAETPLAGDSSFNSGYKSSGTSGNMNSDTDVVFMDEFDDFDDISESSFSNSFGDSETTQMVSDLSMSDFGSQDFTTSGRSNNTTSLANQDMPTARFKQSENEAELFGLGSINTPVGTKRAGADVVAEASEQGGLFSPFDNMPLKTKNVITAIATGVVAMVAAGVVTNFATGSISDKTTREQVRNTGWMMGGAAALASGAIAWD
jgi:twitching motility protein PilJ